MIKNFLGPLLGLALVSISGTTATAQQKATEPATVTGDEAPVYDVVSIKPNKSDGGFFKMLFVQVGFSATSVTLRMLFRTAYGVEDSQIFGAPNWLNSEKYDVEAKMDTSVADELRKLSKDQRKLENQRMLQALLADRLKLASHRESKELPVYALVIAKNGPKLQEAKPGDTYPNGIKGVDGKSGPGRISVQSGAGGRTELKCQAVPVAELVELLSDQLHRTILDKTALTGKYDITLEWMPEEGSPMFRGTEGGQQETNNTPSPESSAPSLFTAIQEQLGLKLEPQKAPVEILVIDHVEKPSEN